MSHASTIARMTADAIEAVGNTCTCKDCVIELPKWDLRVEFYEGKEKAHPNGVSVMPTVITWHRYFPKGYAMELGVGMGKTVADACSSVSATWMLLFFPLLKFLFEEHPHDCMIVDEPLAIPGVPDQPARLLASPVKAMGFGSDAKAAGGTMPEHIGQTLMWEAFAEQLLPALAPGVHHLRCFATRTPGGVDGDVFLDGEKWLEGSEALRRLAGDFPTPSDDNPVYAIKQHLFIRPVDLARGLDLSEAHHVAQWQAGIRRRVGQESLSFLEDVLRAVFVMGRPGSEEEHERALLAKGMPTPLAGQMTVFLASAAARIVLKDKLQFSPTYYLTNYKTKKVSLRQYDQMPIFQAMVDILTELNVSGHAGSEIRRIADSSAEMNVLAQAASQGAKLEGMQLTAMFHPTDEPIDGEDLDTVMAALDKPKREKAGIKKPWWRFW